MMEQRQKFVVFLPPLSPDLNPCDFFLWGVPEGEDVSNENESNDHPVVHRD
jgi:hypothetical protein